MCVSEEAPLTEAGLASRILERYREVYKASRDAEPWLRYGRRTVPVSTIAQQFYCEKAVQYSIEKPLRPSSEMLLGIAGHETAAASGAVLTPEAAVTEAITARETPVCLYEFRVGWQHMGVTILGFVDEAWFRGGNVDLVAERKFSGSTTFHKPYHVQASLYCLGLREMGFSVERTKYRIAIHRRECHDCALLTAGDCPAPLRRAEASPVSVAPALADPSPSTPPRRRRPEPCT